MSLNWKPSQVKGDWLADTEDGSRWMIRQGRFGDGPAFYLNLDGHLKRVTETLEDAKRMAESGGY